MNSWLLSQKDGQGKLLHLHGEYHTNGYRIVIQFEDWKSPFESLERYKDTYTMFNDDVQGTGAVIVGGFINAVKASGIAPSDHRAIFLGSGSAGVGVAKQIVQYFMKEGQTEEEAKKRFWLVDSKVRRFKYLKDSSNRATGSRNKRSG